MLSRGIMCAGHSRPGTPKAPSYIRNRWVFRAHHGIPSVSLDSGTGPLRGSVPQMDGHRAQPLGRIPHRVSILEYSV